MMSFQLPYSRQIWNCVRRRILVGYAIAFCGVLSGQSGGSYLISTVAGDGILGFGGDGGPATSAAIYSPAGVAVDASGNLFIADANNNRIRKVSGSGTITTVAGNGIAGFSGDGNLATNAQLRAPYGVAVDSSGTLYIADTYNYRIRKVSVNGIITTVAGNGTAGSSGDGGQGTTAMLGRPFGIATDVAGNLFIADADLSRIRKLSASGIITTVAGRGTQGSGGDGGPATAAGLNDPHGVAVDTTGNLFIADTGNHLVRKVAGNGIITTVAGSNTVGFTGDGGPATAAQLSYPNGLIADGFGDIFITDTGNQRIRKVSTTGIISTVAGNGISGFSGDGGPAIGGALNGPVGISIDSRFNLWFSDGSGHRVRHLVLSPQLAPSCLYAIDQTEQTFTTVGGSASVSILASASTCPWQALSYASWITINGGAVNSGTSLISFSASPNLNSTSRQGMIWIGGKSVSVTQSGVTCSLDVQTRNVSVEAAGITGATMTIKSNAPDCQWSAAANVPWILMGSPSTGAGNGTVAYTVGVNKSSLRTGVISAAGHAVYVNQAGSTSSSTLLANIAEGGVINAASYAPLIAPGTFVAIYGQNLADTVATWDIAIADGKMLPTTLAGVQVQINGKPAFVNYVSPHQVNVLAPPDMKTGLVDVDLATDHGLAGATVNMEAVSPAFFAYGLQGKLYPVAFFANESVQVAPEGVLGGESHPATGGDYITLYATGLGQTTPAYPAGQIISGVYPIADVSQLEVLLGARPATVLFAGMTFAGVFQINIQVPDGIAAGELPVVLKIGQKTSAQPTILPFK
jgi:uncharacterized protein (TIGR03437 family)